MSKIKGKPRSRVSFNTSARIKRVTDKRVAIGKAINAAGTKDVSFAQVDDTIDATLQALTDFCLKNVGLVHLRRKLADFV
jgi:predicted xylose isomerase-like sugar epimerase